jgi:ElaB/YqjD/DUF883 family membrane-anchored ribosome-binding protein
MGQTTGEMSNFDRSVAGDAGIDDTEPSMSLTPGPDNEQDQDTEEIRARIEQTRAEMTGTIDAIQEKLSPDRLKEQAKEMVRGATVGRAEEFVSSAGQTAKGLGYDMLETIKQNPLPAALAGIGIGWLLMKNNSTQGRPQYYRQGHDRYDTYYGGSYGPSYDRYGYTNTGYDSGGPQQKVGDMANQAQQTVSRVAADAGDKVGQVTGQVGDTVGQMTDQVGDKVGQVGDKVGQIGDQAQYKAGQATDWFQRTLMENPLAVGAVGAAIGAALGLLLPETPQEHQIMGQARDNFVNKAQTTVQDTVQKVQHVAEQATKEATDTAQREAQNQGLTSQPQA